MPFTSKALDFLFENRLHDSRAWFEEHKESYRQEVLKPLCELTGRLSPVMLEIDPEFVTEPRVDKTICRIRRDTRFSKDKSLYRDHMWLIFKRGKMHGGEVPGFYFEINGNGFSYGCGFYQASTAYMRCMRAAVLRQDKAFQKAQQAFASQQVFHMEGECYKRPHYPQQEKDVRQWVERRNICFVADSADFDLLFSDRLADRIQKDFLLLKPVYDFLLQTAQQTQQNHFHA